jgi:hypothetical protein
MYPACVASWRYCKFPYPDAGRIQSDTKRRMHPPGLRPRDGQHHRSLIERMRSFQASGGTLAFNLEEVACHE